MSRATPARLRSTRPASVFTACSARAVVEQVPPGGLAQGPAHSSEPAEERLLEAFPRHGLPGHYPITTLK